MTGLVVALLAVCSAIPDGRSPAWHFLPSDWVDVFEGAFFDSGSGAYLSFQRGVSSMVGPVVPNAAEGHGHGVQKGTKGKWTYGYVVLPCDQGPAGSGEAACADGCQQVAATFLASADPFFVWNFRAEICSDLQRLRVQTFLFDDPDQWSAQMERPGEVRQLGKGDIARLRSGRCLDELRSALGLPFVVERRGAGFELLFRLSDSPSNARLHFGKDACLIDWRMERRSGP